MANATAAFQPKVPISTIRSEFPNAKVMIAVGGWGDDVGFFEVSKSDALIDKFAEDVATMLTNTGADGVGKSFSSQIVCTSADLLKTLIGSTLEVTVPTTSKFQTRRRPIKSKRFPSF
tara:strand:+ start:7328 stop:7681 length:354 start_codon:yes stop_codon:yes gene_type:complete